MSYVFWKLWTVFRFWFPKCIFAKPMFPKCIFAKSIFQSVFFRNVLLESVFVSVFVQSVPGLRIFLALQVYSFSNPQCLDWLKSTQFLAALAALYLPLVVCVSGCHFRIWTQRVTLEFGQKEWLYRLESLQTCPDKKTKRQKGKKTKKQDKIIKFRIVTFLVLRCFLGLFLILGPPNSIGQDPLG